jgi:hypothetical protein
MNFFIFDCNGKIVGNPKGYRTMRGALREENRRGSPAWRAIWAAYDERKKTDPENREVCRIGQRGSE